MPLSHWCNWSALYQSRLQSTLCSTCVIMCCRYDSIVLLSLSSVHAHASPISVSVCFTFPVNLNLSFEALTVNLGWIQYMMQYHTNNLHQKWYSLFCFCALMNWFWLEQFFPLYVFLLLLHYCNCFQQLFTVKVIMRVSYLYYLEDKEEKSIYLIFQYYHKIQVSPHNSPFIT